jgi:RNA polymerase sigma factor (sigma-70 family)
MRLSSPTRLVPKPKHPKSAGDADGGSTEARLDNWSSLMAAAQAGHGGAYQRLLEEMSIWLHDYFRRRLPAAHVDDAVQETLMGVHRRRHTFDPRYPLRPWLAAIAKRKWIDQLRSLGRRGAGALTEEPSVDDHGSSVLSASVLASLLKELRPAQAQLIRLVKLEGYTVDEAAHATGHSPSAVKMNIHRGLGRLTAFLEGARDVE